MQKIFLILFLPLYFLSANFLEISLENKQNKQFEDHIFYDTDTNSSAHEHLSNKKSFNNININGNFNKMIGFDLDYSDLSGDEKYYTNEVYIGTPSLKFFAYGEHKENITYSTKPRDMAYNITNNISTNTQKDGYHYTFLSFLTVSNSDFTTKNTETIKTGDDDAHDELVTRQYNLEIKSISTENFYETTKEDVINNKEYIYPVAISKNITPWLRVYGVAIVSAENYDYSEGEAYYGKKDANSTKVKKTDIFRADEDTGELTSAQFQATTPANARFKGYAYGYKLTAEAHIKKFSFFITSYYKKIILKNQSTQNGPNTYADQTIAVEKLNFIQKYTTFGLRYRF